MIPSKSMPGILNYVIECKMCEWTFVTDSTAKLAEEGRKHRIEHWNNSEEGKRHFRMEKERQDREREHRMKTIRRNQILDLRKEFYVKLQESQRDLKRYRELLKDFSWYPSEESRISRTIAKLETEVKVYSEKFDEADRLLGALQ